MEACRELHRSDSLLVFSFLKKDSLARQITVHDIMDGKDFQKGSLAFPNYSPDQDADQIPFFACTITFYTLVFSF